MSLQFNKDTTIEQLLFHVEVVRERGDVFFIKYDGAREGSDWITVIVSYPDDLSREQIRFEGNDLKKLLIQTVVKYYEENNL